MRLRKKHQKEELGRLCETVAEVLDSDKTGELQNEANSTQMAEKKFHKFLESSLKRSLNGPPPGFFSSLAHPTAEPA